jgi:hypothetical protein
LIFHPADMDVPETRNATDVFHILNNHRGKPVTPRRPSPPRQRSRIGRRAIWLKGIGQVGKWVGAALRCMVLDREAYATWSTIRT